MNRLLEKIRKKTATVCIVGVGYVGLPNAAMFVERGFHVIAADTNSRVVDAINQGKSHIFDPELNERVPRAFATGRLRATKDVSTAASQSEVILISVPTPARDGMPDLQFVEASAQEVAKGLRKQSLVVLESTVYPGVSKEIATILEQQSGHKAGVDFFVAHCPERMNPGDREHTVLNTPRILGGINEDSRKIAKALYETVGLRIFEVSNIRTAELVKLVENTQRDVNIAFINEIARVCEKTGVNVKELIEACSTKWNFYALMPGAGVGGHCLPNNPYYIVKAAQDAGVETPLLLEARKSNDRMPYHTVELIEIALKRVGMTIENSTVALLGIAYKANVDDVRQAPSRIIATLLKQKGAEVLHYDPLVNEANAAKVEGRRVSLDEALKADCLVVLSKHNDFNSIKPGDIKAKAVVDTCFMFRPEDFRVYVGLGVGLP